MTAAVLAIDGGNSKTDVVLIAADGRLLSHVRGPGSSPHKLGGAGCFTLLEQLVAQARSEADVEAGVDADPAAGVADVAAVYLAGADLPREIVDLQSRLSQLGWAPKAYVENDTFALLRTGTDSPDAVAVVCGAGINCVGVRGDGQQVRFPALGRSSGDWGGGWQLGEEALWAAARDEDGRGEPTVLTARVAAWFGLGSAAAVGEAMHFDDVSSERLVELAPLVLQASVEGDPVARAVVDHLVDEITLLAVAALRRLDLLSRPADVVLGGGVIASRDPVLLPGIRAKLASAAPLAVPRVVDDPPVLGAALAGLDLLSAPADAYRRLRESGLTSR